MDRKHARGQRQQQERVARRVRSTGAMEFFNVLTGDELLDVTEAHLPEHRERLYPPTVTLSMFLRQALDPDPSCQRAVNGWAAARAAEGLSVPSVRTGAYCRARARLPTSMVQGLTRASGAALSRRAEPHWGWRGRRVKLLDGTGISMPDTPANQAAYPQCAYQAEGVGFPLARVSALICLSTGAVLEAALGAHRGAGNSELDLARSLLPSLARGDLLLADALYAHYFLVADLVAGGIDLVVEQHGARRTDFRRGKRLAPRDHRVRWTKPRTRPQWMSPADYEAAPATLDVREVKVGGRILVTTLTDEREVHRFELDALYHRRWHVELDLGCLKTTLGMDVLRAKTPDMVEKELWVHLLGYNLIRLLMAEAAVKADCAPREISFKHTVQMWTHWQPIIGSLDDLGILFARIASIRVGARPGRHEPRAKKRRPKSYPWLKVPRRVARDRNMAHPEWQRVK